MYIYNRNGKNTYYYCPYPKKLKKKEKPKYQLKIKNYKK